MPRFTKVLLLTPLLLAGCSRADADPSAGEDQTAALAGAAAKPLNMARPQPEKPDCGHCTVSIPPGDDDDDDELSMILDSAVVGTIDDVVFVEYTSTSKVTHTFDQSVIDDLNDPSTYETIVMMNIPDIQRGLLVFMFDDSDDSYEPVTIEWL